MHATNNRRVAYSRRESHTRPAPGVALPVYHNGLLTTYRLSEHHRTQPRGDAMISDTDYARALAEFLSERGVTRCPTVCVAPTVASVSDADRVALRSHAEIRETVRRTRRRAMQQMVLPCK